MKLSKLSKRRLTTLIDFMDSLPESAANHFNMLFWFRHTGDHQHGERTAWITKDTLKHCGTTACAAGWAATIPAFKRAGLKVNADGDISILPEDFFDLTGANYSLAQKLFYGDRIKTPKQWVTLAKKVVVEHS